jgi:GcrA cell cycle regulator
MTTPAHERDWDKEGIIAALKEKYTRGQSASQISFALNKEFSTSFSRSAVIAKCARMNLSRSSAKPMHGSTQAAVARRAVEKKKAAPKLRVSARDEIAAEIPEQFRDLPVDQSPDAMTIVELELPNCKWPLGEPTSDAFRFCGSQRKGSAEDWRGGHNPYCARHHLIAYPGRAATTMSPEMARAAAIKRQKTKRENNAAFAAQH